jgi:hypothetical protein
VHETKILAVLRFIIACLIIATIGRASYLTYTYEPTFEHYTVLSKLVEVNQQSKRAHYGVYAILLQGANSKVQIHVSADTYYLYNEGDAITFKSDSPLFGIWLKAILSCVGLIVFLPLVKFVYFAHKFYKS